MPNLHDSSRSPASATTTDTPLPRLSKVLDLERRGELILATVTRDALRDEGNTSDLKTALRQLGRLGSPILLDISRQPVPSEELTSVLMLMAAAGKRDERGKPVHRVAVVCPSEDVAKKLSQLRVTDLMPLYRDRLTAFNAMGVDVNAPGIPV